MNNIIIGTAGHVDHGKTCLIKALTGIETDRLKEEKKRGITIELGFAYIDLPGGLRAGIIDVPGHEKFVKNMLAGAGGIDIALLIIAADEGIMPQTEEHLAILSLLDIKKGVIALTKKDIVDEEWLEMMQEEIKERMKGTFMENAAIIPVSSYTGEGIEELKAELSRVASECEGKSETVPFRIPVDRVFSIDGFGTVITGTLIEGVVNEGDSVTIYPDKIQSKVRGLQVHSKPVQTAYPGQRVAVNLSGVHKSDLERGDIIAAEDSMESSMMLDVLLKVTADTERKIKNGSRLHFYHGSREILCKVILLDCDELQKGQEGYAQIRLEEQVSTKEGDRSAVRFYSPLETVGGGMIIDANPKKHKRYDEAVLEDIKARETGTLQKRIALSIKEHSKSFMPIDEIRKRLAVTEEEFGKKIENLVKYNEIIKINPKIYLHKDYIADMDKKCVELLSAHHKAFPLQSGIKREEVASKLIRNADTALANAILQKVTELGNVKLENGYMSLKDFTPKAEGGNAALMSKLEKIYRDAGLSPDATDTVLASLKVKPNEAKEVYNALVKAGTLIRLDPQITVHKDSYEKAIEALRQHFSSENTVTLAQFRDIIGTSRKYAVAVLEHFDNAGYTKKTGDYRVKGIKMS